jgi:hypothetical protein
MVISLLTIVFLFGFDIDEIVLKYISSIIFLISFFIMFIVYFIPESKQ